ncbi:hypothetical protein N9231_06210, partial [Saprospiraceae bacterium]|nr:hypothetical protein [Saprospiraceae bacterium]
KRLKYFLFTSMMALIFLPMWFVPFLQQQYPNLQVERIVGYFGETKKPNIYGKRWMSGQFQQAYNAYVKNKNILQPTAIRLKSQMDFSLYGDIMHANILSGKNGFLFQREGCEAYIGRDFMGKEWIRNKVEKLNFIITHFQKEGIPFLVLMPPLKARIMSEHLPDFYRNNVSEHTNWAVFPDILKEFNIPTLTFSFMEEASKFTPFPFYPPSGQHWTKYGAALAADTIKKNLCKILDIEMVEMLWKDSVELSDAKVEYDNELIAGANFLWNPPLEPLPYPNIKYVESGSTVRPNVLSVGDSFYKLIYEFGIVDGLFDSQSTFWYYNHEVYPLRLENGRRLTNKELDILSEIRQRDVVIITAFEDNLERFDFGFVDMVYDLLQAENN